MRSFTRLSLTVTAFAALCYAAMQPGPQTSAAEEPAESTKSKPAVDFDAQIKPLLAAHCVKCHGPKRQEGGLRLDRRDPAFRGGDSGKVILAGNADQSELLRRISADEGERMPPVEKGNKPLSKEQVALLRKWVDGGANWPKDSGRLTVESDHWAYQPVKDVRPPKFDEAAAKRWVRNPIDGFVLAGLRKKGIEPSPAADRYTLIKRLYYDLVGLPPKPEDVDAFVNDKSPRAYERVVDRLLNSDHFGERWGRHWLDMARYADSDGYEKDNPRPNAWRYRDWVIDAINRDVPFDEFTRQQIAGDLLADRSEMKQLATAFHRQTLTNTEGGTDQEEFRVEAIFDRVATTGTVWLGLTVGCAQCHTHKYDSITQSEYYQLFAFFNNGDETTTEVARSPEDVKRYEREKAAYDAKRKTLEDRLAELKASKVDRLPAWETKLKEELAEEAGNVIRRHDLTFTAAKAKSAAKITRQKDGAHFVSGDNPEVDVYTLSATTDVQAVTGFRIDALTHKSLGGNGPGRTGHGNFVLNRFRVYAKSPDGKETEVPLAAATSDFSQNGFPAKDALSDKPRSGWAVSPQLGKPHWIEFRTKKALQSPESPLQLRFVLEQNYGGQHTLGRFRLRAVTGTRPGNPVPENVRKAIAVAPEKRTAKQKAEVLDYFANTLPDVKKLNGEIAALKKQAPESPYMKVRVVTQRTKNPRDTYVLRRGSFLEPIKDQPVKPDAFAVLPELKPRNPNGTPDRLDLANWLVDPKNPLTPRVTANHVWKHLFGEGLVATVNDFGVRGEKPSYPELLDWLAAELVRRKWSRKELIRTIVTSSTYRQSSKHRPELVETDPQNKLLARQNRFRVEAEIVRDVYLEAAGLLSHKIGGPSVFPPMPADVAALSYAGNFRWNISKGEDRFRRGMYTFFKRTAPHPNLTTFDCPDSNTTNVKRRNSNTPLMALTTLNNIVFVESSQAMAKRILNEKNLQTDADRIRRAFRLCVARPPSDAETEEIHGLLEESRRWYSDHPKEAAKLVGEYGPKDAPPAEAAAWTATCRIIMNVDEFLTRE